MGINEQEAARSELKIRIIRNGWLLKARSGWDAFTSLPVLLAAVEAELSKREEEADAQPRFFHKDWPGPRQ